MYESLRTDGILCSWGRGPRTMEGNQSIQGVGLQGDQIGSGCLYHKRFALGLGDNREALRGIIRTVSKRESRVARSKGHILHNGGLRDFLLQRVYCN